MPQNSVYKSITTLKFALHCTDSYYDQKQIPVFAFSDFEETFRHSQPEARRTGGTQSMQIKFVAFRKVPPTEADGRLAYI